MPIISSSMMALRHFTMLMPPAPVAALLLISLIRHFFHISPISSFFAVSLSFFFY